MQSSKDVPPDKDNPNEPQDIVEGDLDAVRGGAWSLCMNDPSIRDLVPDADVDNVAAELPTGQPTSVGKSKLLHK
ncbi:MAG: hypothetical protein AAGH68_08980 [Pseudomonadota bacterium]